MYQNVCIFRLNVCAGFSLLLVFCFVLWFDENAFQPPVSISVFCTMHTIWRCYLHTNLSIHIFRHSIWICMLRGFSKQVTILQKTKKKKTKTKCSRENVNVTLWCGFVFTKVWLLKNHKLLVYFLASSFYSTKWNVSDIYI